MKAETDQFIAILDRLGYGIAESDVVITFEPLDNFKKHWGEPEIEVVNGVKVYQWLEIQKSPAKEPGDLIVIDFGEKRLCYFGGED